MIFQGMEPPLFNKCSYLIEPTLLIVFPSKMLARSRLFFSLLEEISLASARCFDFIAYICQILRGNHFRLHRAAIVSPSLCFILYIRLYYIVYSIIQLVASFILFQYHSRFSFLFFIFYFKLCRNELPQYQLQHIDFSLVLFNTAAFQAEVNYLQFHVKIVLERVLTAAATAWKEMMEIMEA